MKGNLMRHSESYVVTIQRNDLDHAELLNSLKLIAAISSKISDFNYRVQIVGRLGKNNPNAEKYKKNVYRCYRPYSKIRVADAAYFDVYVYNRDRFYNHDYKRQNDELKAVAANMRQYAKKSLSYI
jgi:hypothetical protein